MHKPKGIILMLAIATLLFISLATIALVFVLNARIKQHERGIDRSVAYYLCETGLSFSLIDFSMGRVVAGVPRTYNFTMAGRTYPITYVVTKQVVGGTLEYNFTASTPSPYGLGTTYKLTMRGNRGVPIFIRGRPQ